MIWLRDVICVELIINLYEQCWIIVIASWELLLTTILNTTNWPCDIFVLSLFLKNAVKKLWTNLLGIYKTFKFSVHFWLLPLFTAARRRVLETHTEVDDANLYRIFLANYIYKIFFYVKKIRCCFVVV